MPIIKLVDDHEYIRTNCYQSQLHKALSELNLVSQWSLNEFLGGRGDDSLEAGWKIISTLKLRTLDANREAIAKKLKGCSIVVWEQDPFENYRDDSPYKNAYNRISQHINVKTWVVPMKKYAERLASDGYNVKFERIWMLPQLCNSGKPHDDRSVPVAFMGTKYPWRARMLDDVTKLGLNVTIGTNSKSYKDYLNDLQDVKVFLCSHESGFTYDNVVDPERHGMYHKDVEVCSQGCFSLSDASNEMSSYVDEKMPAVLQYEHHDQIPDIVKSIEMKDPHERQAMIDTTVERIKELNWWEKTARTLIEG